MKAMLEAAAKKFGVPSEVLDLLDRNWISEVIEEFPSLLLPPIMQTLHREYMKNGRGVGQPECEVTAGPVPPSEEAVWAYLGSGLTG